MFHPTLVDSYILWIDSTLHLIQIIIHSFRLQYVCLFSHRNVTQPYPLHRFRFRTQDIYPTWFLSIHTLSPSTVGTNVSCFHSLLYLSPHLLSPDPPFRVSPTQSFPSPLA